MKLTPDAFQKQLAQSLAPVYLISGDEPLLVGEAADAVRRRARSAGFSERHTFFIERSGAIWDEIRQAAQSLSLFASQRIVEIRMPSGRPGAGAGAASLLQLIESAGEELLVLIITGRLDREVQSAEWVRQAQARGAWLPLWSVERAHFPEWLQARLSAAGLTADDEAVAMLAERTEGNLLAARQEIDKLALLQPGARIDAAAVAASSGDSARFDVFQLGEAVLAGDAARALRILSGLRAEGAEEVLVLWALVRELHGLQAMLSGGAAPRGWRRSSATATAAAAQGARRAPRLPFARLTARAVRADRMAKGMSAGDVWDEMVLLATELCGIRTVPVPRVATA